MAGEDKPVASEDLPVIRIPYDQLFLRMLRIKIIFI
jgi:hypothetical protein